MQKKPCWHKFALLLAFLLLFSGCRENESAPEQSAAPAAPTAESVASQSAPVPQGQELEILLLGPSGQISKLTQIAAMFNQPMVALGAYDQVPEGAMKIDPPQEGSFKWLNQYTLAFTPKAPIEGSTEMRVEVAAGLTALSGAALAKGQTIDISLPKVAVLDTDGGGYFHDYGRALKPAHTVILNQKVDLESLKERAVFIYKEGGKELSVRAEVSEARDLDSRYYGYGYDYGRGYGYIIAPSENLPKNTEYQIVLEAGVKSLAGPIPSERLVAVSFATYGPLRAKLDSYTRKDGSLRPIDPADGLYIYFSNPVKISEAVKALRIDNGYDLEPLKKQHAGKKAELKEGEEDLGEYQETIYLPGGFKPETLYTLRFDEGLTDAFGQKIEPGLELSFQSGSYSTYVRLDRTPGLMETATEPKAPVVLSNIKSAPILGYALAVPEALRFLTDLDVRYGFYGGDYGAARRNLTQEPVVYNVTPPEGATVNGPRLMPVDLAAMFGERLKGRLLYLESFWPDRNGKDPNSTHTLLQISDIGLAVKTAPAGGLIWTTNLAKGQSWPQVELALYAAGGQLLWQGQSDENGLARLPGSVELLQKSGGNDNIFVVGQAEGQTSIWNVNWNDGLELWRWNLEYGDALSAASEKRHWLVSALPLYKPGETAEFKIIAREKRGEALSDAANHNLTLRVEDARGQVVEETAVSTDAYGSFSHKMTLPPGAALGSWGVYLRYAGDEQNHYVGDFLVMSYRAPAFEIKVGELPQKALAGDKAELGLEAVYHFGAPVSGQPVSYEVTRSPAYDFSLPGLSEYNFVNTFSNADEYDDSGYGYLEPNSTVSSDISRLDAEGRFTAALDLALDPALKPRPRHYNAYFSVTDVDQRVISNSAGFLVHPAELYVGLRAENFLAQAGEPYALKALVADLGGNYVADTKIKATVYRREWQNVRRKTPGNAYEFVSRVVDELAGTVEADSASAPVDLSFTPEKAGYYWVLAEIEDGRGRKNQASESFYVRGSGPVGWQMSNNDQLTLVADKKEYKPGDTARILVQSPFSEGEGLLTVERAGVREARVFKIENQTPTLEVPITEDDAPNIYVSVLLTRGRIADKPDENGVDLGKPAMRLGYTELKIPTRRDLLTVEVSPGQAETGPGGEVEVAVAVKDSQGRPFAEAEVALIAADAAVLQLAGDETYYPDRYFGRDEALTVLSAHNLSSLIGRRQWGLKGGNPGGGGGVMAQMDGDAANVRRLFKALAYFKPDLALDAEGRATAKIRMPENLSTFKIYAVATGHARKSGTGSSEVLVTRDLLVRSALPGYAGAGDSFAAAMVLTNRGQNSGEAKVVLSGDNFTLQDGESAEKSVSIAPGESREVPFKVKTAQAGQARFLFSLSMGEESDAAEYVIDVIPPNKLVTQASYEQILPGEKRVELARPGGIDPHRGGLELTLSPSLLGMLSEPFQWLEEYPHRCIEQETSRAWGSLLRLGLKEYLPDGRDEAKLAAARRQVTDHLQRLSAWERGGGFNFWPNDNDWQNRSVYLSAYILEFISSAQQAGFEMPDEGLSQRVAEFLFSSLSADYQWPSWFSERAVIEAQSYALAALAKAGANGAAYQEYLYQNRETLNLAQLTNLIRAIGYQPKGSGQAEQLRELLTLLGKHLSLSAGEAQFVSNNPGAPELWANHTKNSARILETLCLVAPHNQLAAPLLRNLMTQAKNAGGHFGGTQNNVAALSAMAAYAQALEPENPDIAVKVLAGERTMLEAAFNSFTAPPVSGSQPASALAEAGSTLVYQAAGSGQAWAALKLKTAPLEPDLSADTSGGFMLSRSFSAVKPEQGPEGAEKFKRGEVVKVSVTMMVPVPRYNVVLEDRVPAGFEPINFNLADADMTLMGLAGESHWYNHQEIRPERVNVYADYMRPGVYTFSYLARAVSPGSYITPGPTAEEMYSPETYGRGQGQVLTVE